METATPQTSVPACGNCGLSAKLDGSFLSRCGKCKIQLYCSAECQKKHWATHKITCNTSADSSFDHKKGTKVSLDSSFLHNDTILAAPAVMIEPFKMAQAAGRYGFAYWAATNMDTIKKALQYPFNDLPVSRALGFPLGLMGTHHGDINAPNEQVKVLGLNPDPNSPYFGQSRWVPAPTGTVVVVRPDLKPIHINQVAALARYCDMVFNEAAELAKKEANGEQADKHELAARVITPQAFKKFFYEMKEKEEATDNSWKGCECPLEIEELSTNHANDSVLVITHEQTHWTMLSLRSRIVQMGRGISRSSTGGE
jgi:hypothetical protein